MMLKMLEWLIVIAGIISVIAFIAMMYKSVAAEKGSITSKIMVVLGSICVAAGGLEVILPHPSSSSLALSDYGSLGQDVLSIIGALGSIAIIWLILKRRTDGDTQSDTVRTSGPDWSSWVGFEIWQAKIGITFFIIIGVISIGTFIYKHFIAIL